MSARNQRTADGCPSCGSATGNAGVPAARDAVVCLPDLRQTADHDRHDAELRLMSA